MTSFKELYEDTWYIDDNGVRIFLAAGVEKAPITPPETDSSPSS